MSAPKAPKLKTESPIAQIFTKYTSQTLIKYEIYYQDMVRDHNRFQWKLQIRLQQQLSPLIKALEIMQHSDGIKSGKSTEIEGDSKVNDAVPPNQLNQSNPTDTFDKNGVEIGNESKESDPNSDPNHEINVKLQSLFSNLLSVHLDHNGNSDQYLIDLHEASNAFLSHLKSHREALAVSESSIAQIESLLSTFIAEMESSQKRMSRSAQLLFDSFEEFMKSRKASPFLLPLSLQIRIRGRPQFYDVKLQTTDSLSLIVEIIKQKFIDLEDEIDHFKMEPVGGDDGGAIINGNDSEQKDDGQQKGIRLGILRPLGDRDPQQPFEIVTNLDQCLSELNVRQGTQIHILTPFVLKSEAPRPCFTYNYDKAKALKCDYYRCKTCGFNWVCKACKQQCHRDHELVPFMMQHTPLSAIYLFALSRHWTLRWMILLHWCLLYRSYACCYCVKKKKCTILNGKSRKN